MRRIMCRLRRLAGIQMADMQNKECVQCSADMQKGQGAQYAVIISSEVGVYIVMQKCNLSTLHTHRYLLQIKMF